MAASKRKNWRHSFPEVAARKAVKAKRPRLRGYGLTAIMALNAKFNVAFGPS